MEKRLILSTVGSHLSLTGKQLSIYAKKPFELVQNRRAFSTRSALVNDVRTFFQENPDFEIPELPDPNPVMGSAA